MFLTSFKPLHEQAFAHHINPVDKLPRLICVCIQSQMGHALDQDQTEPRVAPLYKHPGLSSFYSHCITSFIELAFKNALSPLH